MFVPLFLLLTITSVLLLFHQMNQFDLQLLKLVEQHHNHVAIHCRTIIMTLKSFALSVRDDDIFLESVSVDFADVEPHRHISSDHQRTVMFQHIVNSSIFDIEQDIVGLDQD